MVLDHGIRHEVSYLIQCGSLLQNLRDVITKYADYFITKIDSYYKIRPLLQIATVQTTVNWIWRK